MTKTVPQTVARSDAPAPNTDEPKSTAVFHEKHPEDQPVIDRITRNIRGIIRSNASRRAWVTRKRMQRARAAREGESR